LHLLSVREVETGFIEGELIFSSRAIELFASGGLENPRGTEKGVCRTLFLATLSHMVYISKIGYIAYVTFPVNAT
jgi:hypothetical protein